MQGKSRKFRPEWMTEDLGEGIRGEALGGVSLSGLAVVSLIPPTLQKL